MHLFYLITLQVESLKTIQEAIFDYESQMFIYATAAQRESRENELEMREPDFSFERLIN